MSRGIARFAGSNRRKPIVPLLALLLVPPAVRADVIPLNTDLQAYLILGIHQTHVSTLKMEPGPGCNIGVNCVPAAGMRGSCGFLHAKSCVIPAPGQVVANQVCGTESFFQVFANSVCTTPTCAMIGHAGSKPDCTDPLPGPIIPDLDGDHVPSCDAACVTDPDDIAAACGVTLPFPACAPGIPVRVDKDQDCSVGDVIPGNGRCDLAAGTYGMIRITKGGRLDFAPGTTVICGLTTQAAVRVTTQPGGPARVLVPGNGIVKFNNSCDVGSDCGMLSIDLERGGIKLGRYGDYTLDACTVGGQFRLGHGNNLKGHYIGDLVSSDKDNDGRCTCSEGSFPPSSTTSSSTSSTSSSTTSTSLPPTSTTAPSTTSTTATVTVTTSSSTSTTATTATTTTATTPTTPSTATTTSSTTETTTTSTTATTGTTTSTTGSTATTSSTTATTATTTTSTTESTTTSSTTSTTAATSPTPTTVTTTSSTTSATDPHATTTTATTATTTSSTTATTATTTTATTATTTSTTTTTTATTATTASTTTATTATTTTATAATTSSSSTTTTPTSTTTSTTVAGQFTRTPGFYKNHPDITQQILTNAGGLTVCGHAITDVDVDHGHSALEALCINVGGVQRAQLLRHLVTAALNMAAGGANDPQYAACDAVCQNPNATMAQLTSCIDQTDAYNQSGDTIMAPFDPPGPANPVPCQMAFATPCTVLAPSSCAVP